MKVPTLVLVTEKVTSAALVLGGDTRADRKVPATGSNTDITAMLLLGTDSKRPIAELKAACSAAPKSAGAMPNSVALEYTMNCEPAGNSPAGTTMGGGLGGGGLGGGGEGGGGFGGGGFGGGGLGGGGL